MSLSPTIDHGTDAPASAPLRLRMGDRPGSDHLDGGWWPRSRDLEVELADLVRRFPPEHGRIVRALYSRPDWDSAPRRISIDDKSLKVGSFPRDDTHLIYLTTSDRVVFRVLVVPPGFSDPQGAEALLAAATRGNTHSATELLDHVTDRPDADPADVWAAEGGY